MAETKMFTVTGEDFIKAVCNRLNDNNIRCYDSAIVREIRKLTGAKLMQVLTFGDVQKWHNDRLRASGLSDYEDKE